MRPWRIKLVKMKSGALGQALNTMAGILKGCIKDKVRKGHKGTEGRWSHGDGSRKLRDNTWATRGRRGEEGCPESFPGQHGPADTSTFSLQNYEIKFLLF